MIYRLAEREAALRSQRGAEGRGSQAGESRQKDRGPRHYFAGASSIFVTVIVSPFSSPVRFTRTAGCFFRSSKS